MPLGAGPSAPWARALAVAALPAVTRAAEPTQAKLAAAQEAADSGPVAVAEVRD